MDWYATIKRYFGLGCYTQAQVQRFAALGKITENQANEIIRAGNAS
ncbi:XkdX family protein [Paenibacillus pasadenensis]|nr:XkdX family protein [Paenibacillus pasadenensis]MCM3748020.1 XkdX family protein [Paenibacillus pasadenensis]